MRSPRSFIRRSDFVVTFLSRFSGADSRPLRSRVIARPSGTEPKIKYYFDVREPIAEGEDFGAAKARAEATLEALRAAFLEIAGG